MFWISSRTPPTGSYPPAWELGMGLTTLNCKKLWCHELFNRALDKAAYKNWNHFFSLQFVHVVCVDGVRVSLNCGQQWACSLSSGWYVHIEARWSGIDRGKPKNVERISLNATLSIINLTRTNPVLSSEGLAVYRLSYGMANLYDLL
jgi:hypothetical protein